MQRSAQVRSHCSSGDRVPTLRCRCRIVLLHATAVVDGVEQSGVGRVELAGDDVVGIEFARAIDVHRLLRTKEKRAARQRINRSKRSRVDAAPAAAVARGDAAAKPERIVVEGVTRTRFHDNNDNNNEEEDEDENDDDDGSDEQQR